ncbi:O-antigen ligase family protein [Massilia sp. LXY-6]|uniref:O-antigen ligase family protein n=1 Tax=Massilia sp. LXY-6 TaxID=3379823 RepID=UPI003EE2D9B7
MSDANQLPTMFPGSATMAPAVPARGEEIFLVIVLCVFCALPFLLGDQPLSLTSVKETGITSPQGDTTKQVVLMAIYVLTVGALVPRLSAAASRHVLLPLIALLAWAALSTAWSDMPGITARRVVALGGTLALGVYMALRWPPRELVRLLSVVALIVLGASFAVAVLMPAAGLDAEHRLRGVFAHKNTLAAFAAIALICAVDVLSGPSEGMAAPARAKRVRLAGLTGLFGLVALGLTASASPVPAAVTAALVMFAIKRAPPQRRHVLTTRLCGALFVVVVLLPWLAPYIGELALLFGRNTDFSGRTLVWRFAIEFFQRSPLFGYGYASFWNGPAGLLFVSYAHFPVAHTHNGALQMLLDGGAVGLITYGTVLAGALRGLKATLNAAPRNAHAWVGGFLILYLCASLAETHLMEPNDLYTVLFAYAVIRIRLTRSDGLHSSPAPRHSLPLN